MAKQPNPLPPGAKKPPPPPAPPLGEQGHSVRLTDTQIWAVLDALKTCEGLNQSIESMKPENPIKQAYWRLAGAVTGNA